MTFLKKTTHCLVILLFIQILTCSSMVAMKGSKASPHTTSTVDKVHFGIIALLAPLAWATAYHKRPESRGAKLVNVFLDLVRLADRSLLIYKHPEESLSAYLPLTYDLWNLTTNTNKLYTSLSPEDEELLRYFNHQQLPKPSYDAKLVLTHFHTVVSPALEALTSLGILLNADNSEEAQQKRLLLHALASLNRSITEFINSSKESIHAKAVAALLFTNLVTASIDLHAAYKLQDIKHKKQKAVEEKEADDQRIERAGQEAEQLKRISAKKEAEREKEEKQEKEAAQQEKLRQEIQQFIQENPEEVKRIKEKVIKKSLKQHYTQEIGKLLPSSKKASRNDVDEKHQEDKGVAELIAQLGIGAKEQEAEKQKKEKDDDQ